MSASIIKMVVIGDGNVGKTCLLETFISGTFPETYEPTVFDNKMKQMDVDEKSYQVELWDTAGQETFDRLRTLSYRDTHVFIFCFSLVSKSTLENIENKWLPEINFFLQENKQTHIPAFFLVGTKCDLEDKIVVQDTTIDALKTKMGAKGYTKTSAKTRINIPETFEKAVRGWNEQKKIKPLKKGGCCIIS